MKKRLLSLALCLALCLGLFPFGVLAEEANNDNAAESETTYVAEMNGTQYKTLTDALEAAKNATESEVTVKLLQDTELTENYYYSNSTTKLILDLNGKEISGTGKYLVLSKDSNASAILQDSSEGQSGQIKSLQVENTCDLTIEGGYIDSLHITDGSLCLNGGKVNQAMVYSGDSSTFTISGTGAYVGYLSISSSIKKIEGSLTGGSFGRINSTNFKLPFSLLLAAGYAFQDDDGYWVTRAGYEARTNITVKKCKHIHFTDNACSYCGMAKSDCTHETVREDGTCTVCEHQYAFKVDNGKFYDSFSEAFEALESGGTITLLKDTNEDTETYKEKDLTLDLQDFTLTMNGGTNRYGRLTILGDVTLLGSDSSHFYGTLEPYDVVLKKEFNGNVQLIDANSVTVEPGCTASVESLQFPNYSVNDVHLAGGSFDEIKINTLFLQNPNPNIGKFLTQGYRFYREDDSQASDLYYSYTLTYQNPALANVKVIPCTQHEFDASNSPCKYCNGTCSHTDYTTDDSGNTTCNICHSTLVACLENKDSTTYYDNMTAALGAVQNGGTLKLLSNVDAFTLPDVAFTLDLNGKTATSITATSDKPTLKATGGGSIGTLKVYSLPVNLLDDGYAFKSTTSGNLVDGYSVDNITKSIYDVTIVEHTSHDFSSSDTCGCGYTCPHDQIGEDYKCSVCGLQLVFEVSNGDDIRYHIAKNFSAACSGVSDNGTLKVLTDAEIGRGDYYFSGKTSTFDLNGKSISCSQWDGSYYLHVENNSSVTITGNGGSLNGLVIVGSTSGKDPSKVIIEGPISLSRGIWLYEGSSMTAKNGASFNYIKNSGGGASMQLGSFLEAGYAFQYTKGENSGQFAEYGQELASNGEIENVKVVPCTTHSMGDNGHCKYCNYICEEHEWKDGKCKVCGYACPHNAGATETDGSYTCNTCGQTMTAKVVAPDGTTTTYYADGFLSNGNQKSGLYFAIKAAESGSTLTVLGGERQGGYVKDGKTLTLDVSNGKTVNGTLNVGYEDTGNKLTIIGNADIEGIIVDPSNTLDLTGWTGSINSMTAKNGATVTLNSGTFADLYIYGQKAGSLLAPGHAFQQVEGGEYVSYSSTANMENVKVVECPHTSVTNGICDYCNTTGFVAAITKNAVTHVYRSMEDALTAAADGDTVTLLANADALDINKSIKLDANGKTIEKLTVSDGVTLSDLLPEGYAYKSGGKWISEPSGNALKNVTMAQIPILGMDYVRTTEMNYGGSGSLNVIVRVLPGASWSTIQWYRLINNEFVLIEGEENFLIDLSTQNLSAGTHTFRFAVTRDGYRQMSENIVVTVNKINIPSESITAPEAMTNLTYSTEEQLLVKAGTATGGTMQYSTEQNGTYSTAIPTGKNAGKYTVWYMVKGDANHNDTEPASLTVTISKADPTYEIPSNLTATYGQTLADVTLPNDWKWADSTQSVGAVGEHSFQATYTPTDTANYNIVTGIDVPVTVKPATYQATVSMTGYTYGETPSTPSVSPNPENGSVTYYYSTTNTNSGGTVWPADTQLNAGTYYLYAVIDATANYRAVTTDAVPFVVSPKSIVGAEVILEGSLTYNGSEQTQGVSSVKLGETSITSYKVSGATQTNAGNYTLTIQGTGNYSGTVTANWSITPKSIEGAAITLGTSLTYNGKEQSQEVTNVTIDGLEATYDVSKNTGTDAGDYTLTVTGNGNFTGTATKDFTIAKAKQTITAENITATYGDTGKKVTATGIGALTYLAETPDIAVDADGSLSFQKAGTYTIKISAAGDTNHEAETKAITVTVAKKALTIKANDKSAYVGNTAPTFSDTDYTITGLVGEDKLENITVKLAYADDLDMTKTGTCAIKATVDGTDDRYSFTTEDGTLTITTRPSSGSSGSTVTKTDTVKNPDGSTTKTETKADGSKTETTTATTPGGSTGSTVTKTDAKGNSQTEASAKLSDKDVKDAQEKGEAVTVPVKDIEAGKDSNSATEIKIDVPKNSGKTTVEIPVDNVTSGTVAVIVHPDGTEEIAKSSKPTEDGVRLEISGSTTVKIIDNSKDFIDTRDHWSRDEVNFVAARELFNGVGDNRFGVSQPMTRGMVNTVLARLSGVDTTPSQGQTWYEIGTEWAKKNGISDGTNPTGNVTREQLATLLYRYAGSPDVSGSLSFADASSVSDYAKNALLWANQNGIVSGVGNNTIAPKANAQRAQVAAMFARYLKNQ